MRFTWLGWALLLAVFAALTAIFAKIGLGGVNADLVTFWRTVVILMSSSAVVMAGGSCRLQPIERHVSFAYGALGSRMVAAPTAAAT